MTANSELPAYLERVKRLNEEMQAFKDDIKEVFAEAKGKGYDVAAMKRILREQKRKEKDPDKWREENDSFDVYASAVALFD